MTIIADRPNDLHQYCFVSGRLSTRFPARRTRGLAVFVPRSHLHYTEILDTHGAE
jgi:hypothetical protein